MLSTNNALSYSQFGLTTTLFSNLDSPYPQDLELEADDEVREELKELQARGSHNWTQPEVTPRMRVKTMFL